MDENNDDKNSAVVSPILSRISSVDVPTICAILPIRAYSVCSMLYMTPRPWPPAPMLYNIAKRLPASTFPMRLWIDAAMEP